MRKCWLVKDGREKIALDLEDKDEQGAVTKPEWIEVKTSLPAGELKRLDHSGLRRLKPAEGKKYGDADLQLEIVMEMEEAEIAKILAWVADWSFTDWNEKPILISRANLRSLDIEAYNSVKDAVDNHTEAQDAEKKSLSDGSDGATRLKRISSSCEPSDGALEPTTEPTPTS